MLKALGDGIWVADAERSVLGSHFPIRMTVVDVGGAALLHSPIPFSPELGAAIERALPIRFLVAPNLWHHLYAGQWLEARPGAALYGAPGLAAKRGDLRFAGELADEAPEAWRGDLEAIVFRAMPLFNEVVLYHPRSRSLIVADLVFHFQRADWGIAGLYVRAAGALGRFGPSRVTRRLIRDRALGRALVDRILEWPFRRVIMSHGEIVEADARERLRSAFAWL